MNRMHGVPTHVNLDGQFTTTRSNRRYALVAVRGEVVTTEQGHYFPYLMVLATSDDDARLARRARREVGEHGPGARTAVVDLDTNTELAL